MYYCVICLLCSVLFFFISIVLFCLNVFVWFNMFTIVFFGRLFVCDCIGLYLCVVFLFCFFFYILFFIFWNCFVFEVFLLRFFNLLEFYFFIKSQNFDHFSLFLHAQIKNKIQSKTSFVFFKLVIFTFIVRVWFCLAWHWIFVLISYIFAIEIFFF